MVVHSLVLLGLLVLGSTNPVKREDAEHDDPDGFDLGSKLTEAPDNLKRDVNCKDLSSSCSTYVLFGFCSPISVYKKWMTTNCRLSCGRCDHVDDLKRGNAEHDYPEGFDLGYKLTEAPNHLKRDAKCKDLSSSCSTYVSYGFCSPISSYKKWMTANCQLSCGRCDHVDDLKRGNAEHDYPEGFDLGYKLTEAPDKREDAGQAAKLRSVLLSLAEKDTEDPKDQYSGDYADNKKSTLNQMLLLARRHHHHDNDKEDCVNDEMGEDYRGTLSTTVGGHTCQKWTSQSPHHHHSTPDKYPNKGLGDHNYCRNPTGKKALWCYTTDKHHRKEYCSLPICHNADDEGNKADDSDCVNDEKGETYRGKLSTTVGGYTCQKWTSQSPQRHDRTPTKYPNKGLGDHNYCRNPTGKKALWCYTTDKHHRKDYCSLPICVNDDENEEDGDWCKYEGIDLEKKLKAESGHGHSYMEPLSSLTAAKAACLKYSKWSKDPCTGITKHGGTTFYLMRARPDHDHDKDDRKTSWTICGDVGHRKEFLAKIESLDATLREDLEDVRSLKKMEEFAEDTSNTLALLQLQLLKNVKAQDASFWLVTLDVSKPTVNWIFNDVTAMQTFMLSGDPMDGKWKEALMNLATLIDVDKEAKHGMKLKMAVGTAMAFAQPIEDYADYKDERTIDMVGRYKSYVKWYKQGVLFEDFATHNAWLYRYVLGAWFQDKELEWARKNALDDYKTRDKIGSVTHKMMGYHKYNLFGVSVFNFADYYADQKDGKMVYRDATLAVMEEVGAVCGGISNFGVAMAQAFGEPAQTVGQPGHCAFIWYKSGEFHLSNDVSGWGASSVNAHKCPAFSGADKDTGRHKAAWYPLMDAAQKNKKYWLTEKMRLATGYKSDVGLKFAILEKLTEWCPQNWYAWEDLVKTLKDKTLIKDASDSMLDTARTLRKHLKTVRNLIPTCNATTSKSDDNAEDLLEIGGNTWRSYAGEKKAWIELDMNGVCDISSVEIQWWGDSIAGEYDIEIQGPHNQKWTKVLDEKDADGESPGFNGWTYLKKGWSEKTTRIRIKMKDGKKDAWGKNHYFGIRQLIVTGLRHDNTKEIASSKTPEDEIDLVDLCALSSLKVKGSGRVTVSTSTDAKHFSVIATADVSGKGSIDLSGLATNIRVAVKGGAVSKVSVIGVRYTAGDLLKIRAQEDLTDNEIVYTEIWRLIDLATTGQEDE